MPRRGRTRGTGTLLLAGMLATFAAPLGAGASSDDAPPAVLAHRGGSHLAPENTFGAFEQAHATWGGRGVWLEMDAQLTRDGVLVVIHDHELDRTTDCVGLLAERDLADLAGCNAAEVAQPLDPAGRTWADDGWGFEPIPTVEEVLARGEEAGWRLMIELKNIPGEGNFDPGGTRAAAELIRLVGAAGFPLDRLLVQSFFPTSLDYVEEHSDIATALLTTAQLTGAAPGVGFQASQNAAYAKARGYEVSAPDRRSVDLGAETVAAIRALGLAVVVWTVNEPSHIAEAIGWGVDGIISDRPDLVYAALDAASGA